MTDPDTKTLDEWEKEAKAKIEFAHSMNIEGDILDPDNRILTLISALRQSREGIRTKDEALRMCLNACSEGVGAGSHLFKMVIESALNWKPEGKTE